MFTRGSSVRATFAWLMLPGTGSGIFQAHEARAASACRSDPIVLLSSGVKVQLYSDMYDAPASITNVAYVLHAPAGTTVVSVSYPSDMTTAIPETFQLIADEKDAKFETTTFVSAPNGKIKMITYAVATAATGAVSRTFKHPGKVNHLVKLGMKLPK